MKFTTVAFVCCLIGCALAYPNANPPEKVDQRLQVDGGYNSDKSGKDFRIEAQVPVWTSENKRHEIDVAGHYAQHFGGPYGKQEPSIGYGGIYRYRF